MKLESISKTHIFETEIDSDQIAVPFLLFA